MIKAWILLAATVFSLQAPAGGGGTTPSRFDFDFSKGESHSFQAVFRDLPLPIYQDYERLKIGGADLGPEAPLTKLDFEYPEEATHWLLNSGIYSLPKGLPGKGYLLQGNNHSDDLDMFLVRKFQTSEGFQPNTKYRMQVTVDLAGDAPSGAIGVGGAPELTLIAVAISDFDPMTFKLDEDQTVRHPKTNWLGNPKVQAEVGTNAVCTIPEESSALELNYLRPCPADLKIPFALKKGVPSKTIEVTTNSKGEFWLMVGGHSGFEGFTGIYYTRIQIQIVH
jgi:hypothetical protein